MPVIRAGDVMVGELARASPPRAATSVGAQLRQSEVQHLDGAIGAQLDVGGLEIAMDDALFVRGLQRIGQLAGNRERLVERHRAARQTLRQILPVNELHDQRLRRAGLIRAACSTPYSCAM